MARMTTEGAEQLEDVLKLLEYMKQFPDIVLDELAAGPWPEPLCGVCRSFDLFFNKHGVWKIGYSDENLIDAYQWVSDWHHALLNEPRYYSPETYARCLAVYAAARVTLKERRG